MYQNENKTKFDSLFFQDDVFSYRSMHDLIQALILADEEDIAERLQQLREVKCIIITIPMQCNVELIY